MRGDHVPVPVWITPRLIVNQVRHALRLWPLDPIFIGFAHVPKGGRAK